MFFNKGQNYNMQEKAIDYVKLHFSVLLAGFTGLFAKLVSLNEVMIVWYRMLFALLIFVLMLICMKKRPVETYKDALKICGLGAILSFHLIFFFGSMKYATLSIGVVCYSLVGFFTVLLEPLILKTKFSFIELAYSLIAVLGIGLIFNFDTSYRFGIFLGVISAALFAIYTLFNKTIQVGKSSRSMLFYELLGGTLVMGLFLPIYIPISHTTKLFPVGFDWLWLFLLAFFCTVILYLLYIDVLKKLSAFTVSLAGNLEPVYGILLAVIFLGEAKDFTLSFYIGMILIFVSVFAQSLIKPKF